MPCPASIPIITAACMRQHHSVDDLQSNPPEINIQCNMPHAPICNVHHQNPHVSTHPLLATNFGSPTNKHMAQCQPLVQNSISGTLNHHRWQVSWVTETSGSDNSELLRPSISVDAGADMKSSKVPAACCHLRPPARTGM